MTESFLYELAKREGFPMPEILWAVGGEEAMSEQRDFSYAKFFAEVWWREFDEDLTDRFDRVEDILKRRGSRRV